MKTITAVVPEYTALPEWKAYQEAQARCREARDRYMEIDRQVFDFGKDDMFPALQAAGGD